MPEPTAAQVTPNQLLYEIGRLHMACAVSDATIGALRGEMQELRQKVTFLQQKLAEARGTTEDAEGLDVEPAARQHSPVCKEL